MKSIENQAEGIYGVLVREGVVLLPTDVGFGLIACGDAAIARIYELKGRPRSKPCVTVANMTILDLVAPPGDPLLRRWIEDVARESPLALVGRAATGSRLLAGLSPFAREQATTSGTIATFLNAGALVSRVAELALADRRMVVGSSANTSLSGNNYELADVPASIRDHVDLVVDGPRARHANPQRLATTILDLTTGSFLRVGIHYETIAAKWRTFVADRVPVAS